MFYILISFLRPFFSSIANIIEGKLANNEFKNPTTMIFYISLMNFAFMPLLLFFGKPTIPSSHLLFTMIIIAIIDVIYLYLYYKAIKEIDISIITALFSLGQITLPIISFLILKEKLSAHQYVGFFIIIFASIALSIDNFKLPKLNKAFYYMFVVSILLSLCIVLEKDILVQDDNWVNVVLYPTAIAGLVSFGFLLKKDTRKDIITSFPVYKKNFKLITLNELICFLGILSGIYGLSELSPIIIESITATMPIFTLLISCILIKYLKIQCTEIVNKKAVIKKLFCFGLILAGVYLTII